MGCHFLLQGIFPTQGSSPALAGRFVTTEIILPFKLGYHRKYIYSEREKDIHHLNLNRKPKAYWGKYCKWGGSGSLCRGQLSGNSNEAISAIPLQTLLPVASTGHVLTGMGWSLFCLILCSRCPPHPPKPTTTLKKRLTCQPLGGYRSVQLNLWLSRRMSQCQQNIGSQEKQSSAA